MSALMQEGPNGAHGGLAVLRDVVSDGRDHTDTRTFISRTKRDSATSCRLRVVCRDAVDAADLGNEL